MDEVVTFRGASRSEFISEMATSVDRSKSKSVFGYRTTEDVKIERSEMLILRVMGTLAIDDIQAPVTVEGGKHSTPMYELELPDRWPTGLFDRMVNLVWIIDQPISPLDVIAEKV